MVRFLFGLVLVAALAGAAAFVPVRGRTVLDRWQSARSAGDFFMRAYEEARQASGGKERGRPGRAQHPPAPPRSGARPRPATPTEHHTERDRAALERIVTEHAEQ